MEREQVMETTTYNNYTEQQALELVAQLSRQFGWKSTIFITQDIEEIWLDITGEDITAEELAEVKSTRMWVKYLDEAMCREGMECLHEAIGEITDRLGK
jgi:hypothetical protein